METFFSFFPQPKEKNSKKGGKKKAIQSSDEMARRWWHEIPNGAKLLRPDVLLLL